MTSCDGICDFAPFKSSVTPESSDVEILRQEIEDYILRLRDQICDDITCLIAQTPTYTPPIMVASAEVDLPNIGSKNAASIDVTPANPVPLGTHILSWAPLTDATSIDDLIIQILVVAENTIRITMQNPTAGAINPDPITFQFITATAINT